MTITDIRYHLTTELGSPALFVVIDTDAGITGYGEATIHFFPQAVAGMLDDLRPYLIGEDPRRIEHLWQACFRTLFMRGGPVTGAAIAGIDMALWDIKGKALDVPVYELLGGLARTKVRLYGHVTGDTAEEMAANARERASRGITAIRFRGFHAYDREEVHDHQMAVDQQVEFTAAIREAVGDGIDILIECHGRFDPLLGGKIGKLIAPYNPGWFEEPVRSTQTQNMAALNATLGIPVAGGESLAGIDAFLTFLSARAAQIIQPDPVTCGGISEIKKICAIAQAHHIQVAPHNAQGPVCTAACLHVDASTPNILIQEVFEDFATPFAAKITDYPTEIVDGHVVIPDRPGLGLDLDEAAMAQYPYDESHFLDMFGAGGWEKRNL